MGRDNGRWVTRGVTVGVGCGARQWQVGDTWGDSGGRVWGETTAGG